MDIRCKIWLEKEGNALFGKGRAILLQALEAEGSLAKAAKVLGMSYRAAWGKLRASEEHLGVRLAQPSAAGHHGMQLTPHGKRMLQEYLRLVRETETFLRRRTIRFEKAMAQIGEGGPPEP